MLFCVLRTFWHRDNFTLRIIRLHGIQYSELMINCITYTCALSCCNILKCLQRPQPKQDTVQEVKIVHIHRNYKWQLILCIDTKLTLPSLTAPTALKRKQIRVIAVAAQAEIWPPDGVPLTCMENEFGLGELHDPRAQLIALIIHISDLWQGRRNTIKYGS